MENKLQELLKWLSEADEYQIDGLYEVLINERIYYIDDCFKDEDIYEDFIKEIKEDAVEDYKDKLGEQNDN